MSPDMIVLRHSSSGACHLLSRICRSAIINAGDGMHEHPTQALLDAFTIRERKKRLAGLKVAIVGDLLHSRVLRSNIHLLTKMGARRLGVRTADADPADIARFGVRATSAVDEAVRDADVIMLLRIQLERMEGAYFPSLREYFNVFGMTEARLRLAKPDVMIMHPGPMNRGVEIASEVADGPYSVILDQVGQRRRRADGRPVSAGRRSRNMKRLLKGGRVDRSRPTGSTASHDVLIDGDRIARVGRDLPVDGADGRRDSRRARRLPGLHRHARAPARARAGAQGDRGDRDRGGGRRRLHRRRLHAEHRRRSTTTPTSPSLILAKAAEANLARVYPIGAVSKGSKGELLADIAELKQAGCVAITDDGHPVATALLLRRALEYAGHVRHAGDRALRGSDAQGRRRGARRVSRGVARAARHSRARAEALGVERGVLLSELTGSAFHVAHMSARASLRAVRKGKEAGMRVTCEVAPHHFTLTDEALGDADSLRHQHQDEPAAARGGRSRRDARRHRRRHRRRDRHRPRAAPLRREEGRVRPRAVRHRRPRDGGVAVARSPGARRPDPAAAAGRAACR